MSQKTLLCDKCGKAAKGFALQSPLKVKTCQEHQANLIKQHLAVLDISAYEFVEQAKDYQEYEKRKGIETNCRSTLTALQKRGENNRNQAHSRLQTAKEALLAIVERSFYEEQLKVDQRYEQVKEQLSTLSNELERYITDKTYALSPNLHVLQHIPAGDLFKVLVGDWSLLLVKTIQDNCLLLPLDPGIPQMDISEKLVAKAMALAEKPDLAEEAYAYALELGLKHLNGDFKKAASKYRRKVAKEILLVLPSNETEQQQLQIVKLYLQAGAEAREEGNYAKSLKKLERGRSMLQQWKLESAELSMQLSVVLSHFGRFDEACEILTQELQHNPSVELSLSLNNELFEIYFQAGKQEEVAEIAEAVLIADAGRSSSFEILRALYLLSESLYVQDKLEKGLQLIDYWISMIEVESKDGTLLLPLIYAEKKLLEGKNEEAAKIYEKGLQAFKPLFPHSFLIAYARFRHASIYEDAKGKELTLFALNILSIHYPLSNALPQCYIKLAYLGDNIDDWEEAEKNYLLAADIFSVRDPLSLDYAVCLLNLGLLYYSLNRLEEAEKKYVLALDLFSVYFPHSIDYILCIKNYGVLQMALYRFEQAEASFLQAINFCLVRFPLSQNHADCLHNLGDLYEVMNRLEQSEKYYLLALEIYSVHFPFSEFHVNCLLNLGILCNTMNRIDEAEKKLLEARNICSVHLPTSILYANCLNNLAELYSFMNNVKDAEKNFLLALEVYSTYFPLYLYYPDCLNNLGYLYDCMNRQKQAEEYYLQALGIYSAHFPLYPNYAMCLHNLGVLYQSTNRLQEAEKNFWLALDIFPCSFSPINSPAVPDLSARGMAKAMKK